LFCCGVGHDIGISIGTGTVGAVVRSEEDIRSDNHLLRNKTRAERKKERRRTKTREQK
jgi:hypothetical protein